MFNTPAQQYIKHLLITAFLTFAAGFGTLLWQFITSHPFDFKTILAAALAALGISGSHAMLALGTSDVRKQATQALIDTYNQVTNSHLSLVAMFEQLIAAFTSQAQAPQAPVVQVNTAPVSNQPAQVVETVTPQQQPVSQPVPMSVPVENTASQFTAPVLPVVNVQQGAK